MAREGGAGRRGPAWEVWRHWFLVVVDAAAPVVGDEGLRQLHDPLGIEGRRGRLQAPREEAVEAGVASDEETRW